jgi:5,10-methylenetetrahydromethanopterin reductase
LPSYRAMLDKEGATGPADVAIVGSASEVKRQIGQLQELGITDFCGAPFGSSEHVKATVATLASLV